VLTGAGQPYKVFTPFRNTLLADLPDAPPSPAPHAIATVAGQASDDIDDWGLHPTKPDWSTRFDWTPGEAGAGSALSRFLSHHLKTYSHNRDHPGAEGGSRLSPHLHFGEIAPWRVVERARAASAPVAEIEKFVTEVAWREFSAHLLVAFPQIVDQAFQPKFDAMPWRDDEAGFDAWTRGQTGYPIVDAGLRELWATGFMHNRVRMIVGSFLVKDLLIDWRRGERWFWDTLVDADLANNVQNWQWIAGSGADAAPYFRVFNPVTQGQKFDAEGRYVRKWVPELARLPDKWLHAPWTAPADILSGAGVSLGRTYPKLIVDHAMARDRALEVLKGLSVRDD
jgi:deoxyribodipyrimidine photo-lyase